MGTITRWLSQRVGSSGYVLTTDIDTRCLETLGLANVKVRRHDIIAGPLPDRTFDLAYARLVLEHLSNPDVALDRMTAAIKPGGWLVVEDFETLPAIPGSEEQANRVSRTTAAMRRVAAGAGAPKRPDTLDPHGEVVIDLYGGSRGERVSGMQDGAAGVIQEREVVTGEVSILEDVVPRTFPA